MLEDWKSVLFSNSENKVEISMEVKDIEPEDEETNIETQVEEIKIDVVEDKEKIDAEPAFDEPMEVDNPPESNSNPSTNKVCDYEKVLHQIELCLKTLEKSLNKNKEESKTKQPNITNNNNIIINDNDNNYEVKEEKNSVQVLRELASTEKQSTLKLHLKQACEMLKVPDCLNTNHYCEFIWRLDDYASEKHQLRFSKHPKKREIATDAFMTNPYGYKMCLILRPKINIYVQKIYLNVCLKALKGPMDKILTWPLTYHGRITILDQLNGRNHFRTKWMCGLVSSPPTITCCAHEMWNKDDAHKCNFITIEDLVSNYLVDNSLLFKVEMRVFS